MTKTRRVSRNCKLVHFFDGARRCIAGPFGVARRVKGGWRVATEFKGELGEFFTKGQARAVLFVSTGSAS